MEQTIRDMLARIEQEHNIRILYAVESGSRAWGFASPDSDYDVRYIYVRSYEDYLRVDPLRDTIEGPLDEVLDFSGWDLKKTLELLLRSNPSLMEWAKSPIVYRISPQWETLAEAIPGYFSIRSDLHHYFSMAMSNRSRNLKEEQVKLKKYLYVLRPILCCRWLERFGTLPPVLFSDLCQAVLPEELAPVVAQVLERKQYADEKELVSHIPELDAFFDSELPRIQGLLRSLPQEPSPGYDGLNRLFRQILAESWA